MINVVDANPLICSVYYHGDDLPLPGAFGKNTSLKASPIFSTPVSLTIANLPRRDHDSSIAAPPGQALAASCRSERDEPGGSEFEWH